MHITDIVEFQPADEHEYGPEVSLAVRLEHEQQQLLAAS
jgi:hypothetical protein